MDIYVATDHAGFEHKETVYQALMAAGHDVVDCGAYEFDPVDDYPKYIQKAAKAVAENPEARAIIFGGSGQGEAMAANRFIGARAAVYYGGSTDIISLSRQHNDANVLSIGARFISLDEAVTVVRMWLETNPLPDEKYMRRIAQMDDLENVEPIEVVSL